jgi:hypothetical protein
MFDTYQASEALRESNDGLSRVELEEWAALIREFVEWIDECESLARAALAALAER